MAQVEAFCGLQLSSQQQLHSFPLKTNTTKSHPSCLSNGFSFNPSELPVFIIILVNCDQNLSSS